MILLIDNYDSFTYNLVQYLGELGEDLRVFRNVKITLEEIERLKPARIVISPGPGTPTDAGITEDAVRHFHKSVPILGVCLGHQAIGEVFGGKIVRAPTLMHGKTSEIFHDGKRLFEGLPQGFPATRYLSLMVTEVPSCLEISARTKDGVVMGLRPRDFPSEGIQCHGDSMMSGAGVRVATHGNRSATSRCGSADVMEALGLDIQMPVERLRRAIRDTRIGFLFAQRFHTSMKHVMTARMQLKVRTVFNILGPLANPAGARFQVIGVSAPEIMEMMANALNGLNTYHAFV